MSLKCCDLCLQAMHLINFNFKKFNYLRLSLNTSSAVKANRSTTQIPETKQQNGLTHGLCSASWRTEVMAHDSSMIEESRSRSRDVRKLSIIGSLEEE